MKHIENATPTCMIEGIDTDITDDLEHVRSPLFVRIVAGVICFGALAVFLSFGFWLVIIMAALGAIFTLPRLIGWFRGPAQSAKIDANGITSSWRDGRIARIEWDRLQQVRESANSDQLHLFGSPGDDEIVLTYEVNGYASLRRAVLTRCALEGLNDEVTPDQLPLMYQGNIRLPSLEELWPSLLYLMLCVAMPGRRLLLSLIATAFVVALALRWRLARTHILLVDADRLTLKSLFQSQEILAEEIVHFSIQADSSSRPCPPLCLYVRLVDGRQIALRYYFPRGLEVARRELMTVLNCPETVETGIIAAAELH